MQLVQCKFRRGDARAYTYEWHGAEPLSVGDHVVVETKIGPQTVIVSDVDVRRPSFPLKAIDRLADAKELAP